MNEMLPGDEDIDDVYRRSAERDPSQPSEAARRSILQHAGRLAIGYAATEAVASDRPASVGSIVRRRSGRAWRPAVVGMLAAALLAGLVVVPRLWSPPPPFVPTSTALLTSNREETTQLDANMTAKKSSSSVAAPAAAPAPRLSEIAPASRADNKPSATAQLAAAAPAAQEGARDLLNNAQAASGAVAGKTTPYARQRADSSEALRRAAQGDDSFALSRVLGQPGGDINARDEAGRTALMLAVLNGHLDAVETLLTNGADPNIADAVGTLPLAAALQRSDLPVASALRHAGARESP